MRDLSIEELVALATAPIDENEEAAGELNDVQKFVIAKDIKSGEKKVSATNVFSTYLKWKRGNPALAKGAFFFFFSQYFERVRKNQGIFYLLDGEAFDMEIDKYRPLRDQVRAEHNKARKSDERKN